MIRLIAVDMDGTLLNSSKQTPIGLEEVIDRLCQMGVKFVIASGRQFQNLREFFTGREHMVTFISENGALIFEQDRNIYSAKIEERKLAEFLAFIREIKDAYPIFCGIKGAYVENDDPLFLQHAKMYNARLEIVSNLAQVTDDDICKIAVFDNADAEMNSYPILMRFGNHMQVTLSGNCWVDIMETGVSKGSAIKILQDKYNIASSECMAFGDYLNDIEMMKECGYSYAMANARPQLKEVCRYETASNDENGVMEAIMLNIWGEKLKCADKKNILDITNR